MKPPVYVALDTNSLERALEWAAALKDDVGGLKVGLEFVNAHGPEGVRKIVSLGAPVFLDVKLHDIPNTVSGAVKALAPLGVALLNVHAGGGTAMMKAAKAARDEFSPRTKLVAVTVLTSLEDSDLAAMGVAGKSLDHAVRLANLTREAGLDGVVCSPLEIAAVRRACGKDFLIVMPGVRAAGAVLGDQKRVMTPREAIRAGADYLVIGRPITGAADPAAAARKIAQEF
jgi:orotidine-5'-phosphate decarboxylase